MCFEVIQYEKDRYKIKTLMSIGRLLRIIGGIMTRWLKVVRVVDSIKTIVFTHFFRFNNNVYVKRQIQGMIVSLQ
jgi:hypothetical protein